MLLNYFCPCWWCQWPLVGEAVCNGYSKVLTSSALKCDFQRLRILRALFMCRTQNLEQRWKHRLIPVSQRAQSWRQNPGFLGPRTLLCPLYQQFPNFLDQQAAAKYQHFSWTSVNLDHQTFNWKVRGAVLWPTFLSLVDQFGSCCIKQPSLSKESSKRLLLLQTARTNVWVTWNVGLLHRAVTHNGSSQTRRNEAESSPPRAHDNKVSLHLTVSTHVLRSLFDWHWCSTQIHLCYRPP